ncbi:hypothetical protein TNCV_2903031 [Trichonephila clavipes]|nr:hypothetical protein TNCV_2903031 [Trichonephila clavipes]
MTTKLVFQPATVSQLIKIFSLRGWIRCRAPKVSVAVAGRIYGSRKLELFSSYSDISNIADSSATELTNRFRQPFLEGDGTIAIWDFYISLELEQNEREVEHCT